MAADSQLTANPQPKSHLFRTFHSPVIAEEFSLSTLRPGCSTRWALHLFQRFSHLGMATMAAQPLISAQAHLCLSTPFHTVRNPIMDPASILGLIGGCVGISKAAEALTRSIQGMIATAEQNVTTLVAFLQTLDTATDQLSRRLLQSATLSLDDRLESALKSCLHACVALITDLHKQLEPICKDRNV
jgi:hypothetical protein